MSSVKRLCVKGPIRAIGELGGAGRYPHFFNNYPYFFNNLPTMIESS